MELYSQGIYRIIKSDCYELNCTPSPKKIFWIPNHQCLKMCPHLEMGQLQIWVRMRSYWGRVGPQSNTTGALIGRWPAKTRRCARRMPQEERGSDRNDASTSQGKPNWGSGSEQTFPQRPETLPAPWLKPSSLQHRESATFCSGKPPVCGTLSGQPLKLIR